MAVHAAGTHVLVSQTPDSAATAGAGPADGVTSDVPTDGQVDAEVDADVTSRHDERHEGSSFEPVPRDPGATTRPYPPEADPEPDVVVPEAVVPGEQADPDRRAEVFPEDEPTD